MDWDGSFNRLFPVFALLVSAFTPLPEHPHAAIPQVLLLNAQCFGTIRLATNALSEGSSTKEKGRQVRRKTKQGQCCLLPC